MRLPIQAMLLLTLGLGTVALIGLLSLLVDSSVVDELDRRSGEAVASAGEQLEVALAERADRLRENAHGLAHADRLRASLNAYALEQPAELQQAVLGHARGVAHTLARDHGADLLVVTGPLGDPLVAVSPGLPAGVSRWDGVLAMARNARATRPEHYVMALGGELVLAVAVPASVGGFDTGALVVGRRLDRNWLQTVESRVHMPALLLTGDRVLETSPGVTDAVSRALTAGWNEAAEGATPPGRLQLEDGDYRVGWTPLSGPSGELAGMIALARPSWEETTFRAGIQRALSGIAVAAIALSLVVSMLFGRHMALAARKLANACDRIAAGDYRTRVSVDASRELAQVAEATNRMARKLELRHGDHVDNPDARPDRDDDDYDNVIPIDRAA